MKPDDRDEEEVSGRHIRVFVSSTFRDMQTERDLLVKRVFPKIRRLCASRHVMFTEIDLRWGITNEQAINGQVVPLCLDEIQRCRPFFIALLGDRYGHVPKDGEIPEPVLNRDEWLRSQRSRSVTELEIIFATMKSPMISRHAFFYFRRPEYKQNLPESVQDGGVTCADAAERDNLSRLKRAIQERCVCIPPDQPAIAFIMREEGTESSRSAHHDRPRFPLRMDYAAPDELAHFIERDLTELVDYLYPAESQLDPLDLDYQDHEIFSHQHVHGYLAKQDEMEAIARHLERDRRPFVISGDAGCGKSALLVNWVRLHRERFPDERVIAHYVGATPTSSDWHYICRRLIGELARQFGFDVDMPQSDYDLRHELRHSLYRAANHGRGCIVIDDLSRLDDLERIPDFSWLPSVFPRNICLLVSAQPGAALDELRARNWSVMSTRPFSESERRHYIREYLAQYSKALDTEHVHRIAMAQQTASPLFMRTLLDELILLGEHERLGSRIAFYLEASDITSLYERVLTRWEQDYETEAPGLVKRFATVFFCERDRGIGESELPYILSWPDPPLPLLSFEPLRFAAESILSDRSGVLFLSNRYIWEAIGHRYLPCETDHLQAMAWMARYHQEHGHRWDEKVDRFFQKTKESAEKYPDLSDRKEHLSFGITKATLVDSAPLVERFKSYVAQETAHRRTGHHLGLAGNLCLQALFIAVEAPEAGLPLWPATMALEKLTEARQIAVTLNNAALLGNVMGLMGLVYTKLNRFDEAMAAYMEAERILRAVGIIDGLRDTLINIGNLLSMQHREKDAERYFREAAAL